MMQPSTMRWVTVACLGVLVCTVASRARRSSTTVITRPPSLHGIEWDLRWTYDGDLSFSRDALLDYAPASVSDNHRHDIFGVSYERWDVNQTFPRPIRYLGWRILLSVWVIVTVLSVVPIAFVVGKAFERVKKVEVGHCKGCGYDLRATRERCPECGTFVK